MGNGFVWWVVGLLGGWAGGWQSNGLFKAPSGTLVAAGRVPTAAGRQNARYAHSMMERTDRMRCITPTRRFSAAFNSFSAASWQLHVPPHLVLAAH